MRGSRFAFLAFMVGGAAGIASAAQPHSNAGSGGQPVDLTAYVNPMIGTGGEGHTFPGATLPFGMVQLSPSNDKDDWNWASGYNYAQTDIKGFAHTHLSGAGLSALGDILLMPARKPSTFAGSSSEPGSGYRSRFSHAREFAEPGYYRVHLDTPDVDAELTATLRTGFHRYTFNGNTDRYVIIDPTHGVGDRAYQSGLEIVSDHEVRGYKRSRSQSSGDRAVYFIARFSQPFVHASLTDHDVPVAVRGREGSDIKASLQFSNTGPRTLSVKVAISNSGYAGAEANFAAEAANKTFDDVRHAAHESWQEWLSKVVVDEGSPAKKRTFYTALYHAGVAPNLISDVTGDYSLEGKVRHSRIPQYSNFSTWDTYRAQDPFLTIVDQKQDAQIVNSMISRRVDEGIDLPIWEAAGHDNRVMIGYPLVAAIADAVLKDIPGVDPERAYSAIRASAFDREKSSNVYDASGMDGYLAYSFVPADVGSSVSKTAEQNYEDWIIGRVARKLGKTDDARLFAERSLGYRQLYEPSSGFLVPRLSDGRFVPFDANDWDDLNVHYVSGNIWAYSAYTPHDMIAAIQLHGGRAQYARWLESILTDNRPLKGKQNVDISGFIGRYGHADEPGHQLVYLFNLLGQPWRTEYYVNRIEREMYTNQPDGIVNNDDLGQMSAWYVLSSLGFYPITPGDFIYQIGSPSFREARIDLGAGKSFEITADKASDINIYVQSATFNGTPYRRSYLTHDEIMAGGTLHLVMGPAPAKDWGSRPEDTSLGDFDEKARASVPHTAGWSPYDPVPGSHFGAAKLVRLVSQEPGASIRYTLDGTQPGATSPLYSGPIRITRDTILKAVAFAPTLRPSSTFSKQYRKTADADLKSGYPKIQLEQKDIGYGRADGSMLIDEVEGTKFYGDHKWTGRQGDITATIDLGEKRSVREVSVGYLDDPMNGILPPRLVEVWGGNEPGELRQLSSRKVSTPAGIQQEREEVALELGGAPCRYFKVHMVSWGAMPREISAGKIAWLFVDEILLR